MKPPEEILENMLNSKLNIIVDKYGELNYEVIEHPYISGETSLLQLKIAISKLREKDFFVFCGYGHTYKETAKDNRLKTVEEIKSDIEQFLTFDKHSIWITFDGIENCVVEDVNGYFDCELIRYAISKKLKIPYVDMTDYNKVLMLIQSMYDELSIYEIIYIRDTLQNGLKYGG